MLYDLRTVHDTTEREEIRDGEKVKVKLLVQHRKFPVRKQANQLLQKLYKNLPKNTEAVAMNTNGQNLTRNTLGIVFNEGNREENVTSKLVKDKDKKALQDLEKNRNVSGPADSRTDNEKKMQELRQKYDFGDMGEVQHTFRVVNLVLSGDPTEPDYFEKGKGEFDVFLEEVKEHILNTYKVRVRGNHNYRKQMLTDKFFGVIPM